MDIYWASFTLLWIFLPMLMSCIVSLINHFRFNSIQYNFNDHVEIEAQTPVAAVDENNKGCSSFFQFAFEKIISKARNMPKPLRHVPLLQSAYHMYVMSELVKIAFAIKEEKKLLKNLDKILEESGLMSGRKYFYGSVHEKLIHKKLNKYMDKQKWQDIVLNDEQEHKRTTKFLDEIQMYHKRATKFLDEIQAYFQCEINQSIKGL